MDDFFDMTMIQELQSLGEQSGTDLLGELLNMYRDTTPPMLDELTTYIGEGKLEDAGKVAHKLKSSCANLGLKKLRDLCQELENKGHAGSDSGTEMQGLLDELKKQYDVSLVEIKKL